MNREGSLLSAGLLITGFLLLATHLAGQTPDSSVRRIGMSADGSDTIILSYGFGSSLTVTAPSFRIDSTSVIPTFRIDSNARPGPSTATLPFTTPGHSPQQMTGGTLRPPIPGVTHIQQQYDILPLQLLPHASGQLLLAMRQRSNDFNFTGVQLFSPDALGADFARDYEQGHADLVFQWLFQGFMLCMLLYMLFQWGCLCCLPGSPC